MVDLAAMSYSDDDDEQNVVHDSIDDSVVAGPDSVEVTCQLEGIFGTRLFHQTPQASGDPLLNRPLKLSDLPSCGR